MLNSYARTNEFQDRIFLDFLHFEIFPASFSCYIIDFSSNSNFMENATECSDLRFKLEYWISNIVICSFVFLIFLYVLLALLYHEIMLEKRRQIGFLQLSIEKRYHILSKYTCIFIATASLVLFVSLASYWPLEGIAIFSGSNQTAAAETVCVVFPPIILAALTLGNGLVYSFLWLRQRVIYVHPSMKVLNNKCISVFSFVVLILWILFWMSLSIVYLIKVQYRLNGKIGCIIDKDFVQPYNEIVFAWTAGSILMQILLLCLFIYPIFKQARWSNQQNNHNLMRRVKKAVVFSSICLGTDITTIVVYLLFATECVANSTIWVYIINLLINHLITIGCFDHWKNLLWPWNVKCCGVVRTESDANETINAASFSASQNQSQLTTIT